MLYKKLIKSAMFKEFLCSRPVIDVPVDEGDDAAVVTESAKTLRTGARSGLVVVAFAAVVIRGLVMLTELGIVVVFVAAIALEVFVTVPCVGDVRAGVWTGTAIDSDVTITTRVGVMVRVLIDLLTDKIIGFVTGIGVDVLAGVDTNMVAAAMVDLEFIIMRVSLEDALRFCC